MGGKAPTSTPVQVAPGTPPLKPPGYGTAKGWFENYFPQFLDMPPPTYQGEFAPQLSPMLQNMLQLGQNYAMSPLPGIYGQSMSALGQFMGGAPGNYPLGSPGGGPPNYGFGDQSGQVRPGGYAPWQPPQQQPNPWQPRPGITGSGMPPGGFGGGTGGPNFPGGGSPNQMVDWGGSSPQVGNFSVRYGDMGMKMNQPNAVAWGGGPTMHEQPAFGQAQSKPGFLDSGFGNFGSSRPNSFNMANAAHFAQNIPQAQFQSAGMPSSAADMMLSIPDRKYPGEEPTNVSGQDPREDPGSGVQPPKADQRPGPPKAPQGPPPQWQPYPGVEFNPSFVPWNPQQTGGGGGGMGGPPIGGQGAGGPFGPTGAYDVFRSAVPVMNREVNRSIDQALGRSGLSGTRYSSSAQRSAAEAGAGAAERMTSDLSQRLYDVTQQGLNRQLQAALAGPGAAAMGDQMMQDRLKLPFGMGTYEQGRQDQFAGQAFQDWGANRFGFLPMIAQLAMSQGSGSPGSAPVWGTKTTGGSPGLFDYITAMGPTLAALPWGAMSDKRLKTGIKPSRAPGLEQVRRLKTYDYEMFGEPRTGVVAQQLEKIEPRAVTDVGGIKMVRLDAMLPMIASSIKTLDKRLGRLEKGAR